MQFSQRAAVPFAFQHDSNVGYQPLDLSPEDAELLGEDPFLTPEEQMIQDAGARDQPVSYLRRKYIQGSIPPGTGTSMRQLPRSAAQIRATAAYSGAAAPYSQQRLYQNQQFGADSLAAQIQAANLANAQRFSGQSSGSVASDLGEQDFASDGEDQSQFEGVDDETMANAVSRNYGYASMLPSYQTASTQSSRRAGNYANNSARNYAGASSGKRVVSSSASRNYNNNNSIPRQQYPSTSRRNANASNGMPAAGQNIDLQRLLGQYQQMAQQPSSAARRAGNYGSSSSVVSRNGGNGYTLGGYGAQQQPQQQQRATRYGGSRRNSSQNRMGGSSSGSSRRVVSGNNNNYNSRRAWSGGVY